MLQINLTIKESFCYVYVTIDNAICQAQAFLTISMFEFRFEKEGEMWDDIYVNAPLKNIAYIDGQNLYMGTAKSEPFWSIDLVRFRVYLEKKYNVEKAYYYLGYLIEENQELYEELQSAGFIVVFREHNSQMLGKKKGNVDSDIIFSIMKRMYKQEPFDKIVLVSGDGDYKMIVDFLIEENRFEKILFPNKKFFSSLYKSISNNFFSYLDDPAIKEKIEVKKSI